MASSSTSSTTICDLQNPTFERETEFVTYYRSQTFDMDLGESGGTRKPFSLNPKTQDCLLTSIRETFEDLHLSGEKAHPTYAKQLQHVRDLRWVETDLRSEVPDSSRAKCQKLMDQLEGEMELQSKKLAYLAVTTVRKGESLQVEGPIVTICSDESEELSREESIQIAKSIVSYLEELPDGEEKRDEALDGVTEFAEKFSGDPLLGTLAEQLQRYIKFCALLKQRTFTAKTALENSLEWQLAAIQKELEPYLGKKSDDELPEMGPLIDLCDRAFEIINRLKHYQGQLNTLLKDPPTRYIQETQELTELLHRKELTIHQMIKEVVHPVEHRLSTLYQKAYREVNASIRYRKRVTRKSKSWIQLAQEPFGDLMAYRQYTKSYLYIDDKNKLQYAWVTWPGEEEQLKIVNYVKRKVDLWLDLYKRGTPTEQAILFDCSLQLLCGLWAIEMDYTKPKDDTAYKTLRTGVAAQRQRLWDHCQELRRDLKASLCEAKTDPKSSIYSLLDYPQYRFPLSIVKPVLEQNYGKRLTNRALELYVEKHDAVAPQVLSREDLQFILIGIAADVTIDDVKAKWESEPHPADMRFEDLSDEQLQELVLWFRRDPDGNSLLRRFHIPLCWDKQMTDADYLAKMPCKTLVENNRKSTLQVLTDIEAAALWNPQRCLRMDDDTMLERLHDFLKDPTRIDRFNSDRYLHFLEVAAATLSLLERCRQHPNLIDSFLKPVINALEHTRLAASWSYRNPEFRRAYQILWSELLKDVKLALRNKDYRSGPILEKLLIHPQQSNSSELDPTELSRQLLNYEYLSRRISYWNSYVLEQKKSLYFNEHGYFHDYKYAKLRVGSLFTLYEDGRAVLYKVVDVHNKPGYACQVCMPVKTDRYLHAKEPIPIKLVFQGTLLEKISLARDKQLNGPGYALWDSDGEVLFKAPLEKAMRSVPGAKFALSFTGHSLGASDAQNAAARVGSLMLKDESFRKQIDSIWVTTFNAAGIPRESEARYAEAHNAYPDIFRPVVHSYVPWDYVHFSGETKLGANTPALFLEVTHFNRNRSEFFNWLARHRDYAFVSSSEIRPTRVLCQHQDRGVQRRFLQGFSIHRRSIIARAVGWSRNHEYLKAPMRFFQGVMRTAGRLQDLAMSDMPTVQREIERLRHQLEMLNGERLKLLLSHSWSRDEQELERYAAQMENIEKRIKGTSEEAKRAQEILAQLVTKPKAADGDEKGDMNDRDDDAAIASCSSSSSTSLRRSGSIEEVPLLSSSDSDDSDDSDDDA